MEARLDRGDPPYYFSNNPQGVFYYPFFLVLPEAIHAPLGLGSSAYTTLLPRADWWHGYVVRRYAR
jgi:hypothetical protein